MSFETLAKTYLAELQDKFGEAIRTGEYTPELSYRPTTSSFIESLVHFICPEARVIYEPKRQSNSGRPDWRFYNSTSLGVYGYAEAKELNVREYISPSAYESQVGKYLNLGYTVILTDGLDFIFYDPSGAPRIVHLIEKPVLAQDWQSLEPNTQLEMEFRSLLREAGFRISSEENLVEFAALRTRELSTNICELTTIPEGSGLDELENQTITALRQLKQLVETHHDRELRNPKAFGDFLAQTLTFGLIYAHRVLQNHEDTPRERDVKMKEFWTEVLYRDHTERLRPFRTLFETLDRELNSLGPLGTWFSDCRLLLAHTQFDSNENQVPDYHALYEHFLASFDAKTRFDFGAFYTPRPLAQYALKLTEAVVARQHPERSLYEDGNRLIDPCCGTGTFLEQLIMASRRENARPQIVGFEILPAPYALAHYRLAMLADDGSTLDNVEIVLTNTLSDALENEDAVQADNLIAVEQAVAREKVRPPIRLVIGNPPSSDSPPMGDPRNFTIIEALRQDFRPPEHERRTRQNTQKQLKNAFIYFLRWSCNKVADNEIGILCLVLPRAFAENPSYEYARKWLLSHFRVVWVLDIDLDGRTGVRTSNLFRTLQGRMLLLATTASDNHQLENAIIYHGSIAEFNREQKIDELSRNRTLEQYFEIFRTIPISEDYSFRPTPTFDNEKYSLFWPLYPEGNTPSEDEHYIFARHCSGLKLQPTSLLIHANSDILRRRSQQIGDLSRSVDALKTHWFKGQKKPPGNNKFTEAVRLALGTAGRAGADVICRYSYRPFVTLSLLMTDDVLTALGATPGGSRSRPEVRSAFQTRETVGIAVAPSPKEIGQRLHRFASFCWFVPDNDLASRGNAHIFCNRFPSYKRGRRSWDPTPLPNINAELIQHYKQSPDQSDEYVAQCIVYYVYAVLCSDTFLDSFEGALFKIRNCPKIPFPADRDLFWSLAEKGQRLANLENPESPCELGESLTELLDSFASSFRLKKYQISNSTNCVRLFGEEGEVFNVGPIDVGVLDFEISGYSVLKEWLKIHSYVYTRTPFTIEQLRGLLILIHKIQQQISSIRQIDTDLSEVLSDNMHLFRGHH
ncbi:MAG: N-6 DNA methylase [Planctomycetes bacterium]|nr:N-6 DNA methylase [Planctomycetota bacterium]